jgi:glycolate oxidase iron-sulfur subunit
MSGLRRRGERAMPAFHMVELLDASIRGLSVDQILSGEKSLDLKQLHTA